jgi:hypothetical protein
LFSLYSVSLLLYQHVLITTEVVQAGNSFAATTTTCRLTARKPAEHAVEAVVAVLELSLINPSADDQMCEMFE